MLLLFFVCVCVCFHDMYCIGLNLSSEFPVSAAMANMELLDEHSLAACGVLC